MKISGAVALVFALSAGVLALESWVVMLLMGAVHSGYESFPNISYGVSIAGVMLGNFVGGMIGGRRRG